ncbi:MAG: hypothetical protein JXI43_13005 [Tissierellales bacterium]|nr:hypothetical protein [Tissierellales bacterium]
MPLDTLSFTGEKDPIKKARSVYSILENSSIDAVFKREKKTQKDLTRTYVELIIEEFSTMTQNQALFNKFLQIDTKLEKSLREYQAEIKGLLYGIIGTSMMQPQQPAFQQPVSMPAESQEDRVPIKSIGIE